jgi:hypothetical protein
MLFFSFSSVPFTLLFLQATPILIFLRYKQFCKIALTFVWQFPQAYIQDGSIIWRSCCHAHFDFQKRVLFVQVQSALEGDCKCCFAYCKCCLCIVEKLPFAIGSLCWCPWYEYSNLDFWSFVHHINNSYLMKIYFSKWIMHNMTH